MELFWGSLLCCRFTGFVPYNFEHNRHGGFGEKALQRKCMNRICFTGFVAESREITACSFKFSGFRIEGSELVGQMHDGVSCALQPYISFERLSSVGDSTPDSKPACKHTPLITV